MEQEPNKPIVMKAQIDLDIMHWQAKLRGQWAEALANAQAEFTEVKKSAKAVIRMKSGGT